MEPHEHLLSFACGGLQFDGHQREELVKHSLVLERFLRNKAQTWVEQRFDEPLLEVYQNDGTPLSTTQRIHVGIGEFHVRRSGRTCTEYLNERVWLVDGHGDVQVVYKEPRVLERQDGLDCLPCRRPTLERSARHGRKPRSC